MTITRDEDVIGGEPRIDGTRIGVRHIAVRVINHGQSPAHVVDQLDLTMADVYEALSYYYAHIEEIDEIEKENKAAFDRIRKMTQDDRQERPVSDEEFGSMPERISSHFDRVRDRLDEDTDDSAT